MIECPACGSSDFSLWREQGHGDAGFAIHCSDCDNATAQVVARTLDSRLQREDQQTGISGFQEDQ